MLTSYWYSLANCSHCIIWIVYASRHIDESSDKYRSSTTLLTIEFFEEEGGGTIDYTAFIDESTTCSMYNGGFVLLLPLVPFLCTWYLSVQRNKLQIIHTLYIIPLISNYTSVFISHRQVITYQNTLDLSHQISLVTPTLSKGIVKLYPGRLKTPRGWRDQLDTKVSQYLATQTSGH